MKRRERLLKKIVKRAMKIWDTPKGKVRLYHRWNKPSDLVPPNIEGLKGL
jgi:hypothetical protein